VRGEIRFKKFNPIFKLKILESIGDTSRHQIRWNFDKFKKNHRNALW